MEHPGKVRCHNGAVEISDQFSRSRILSEARSKARKSNAGWEFSATGLRTDVYRRRVADDISDRSVDLYCSAQRNTGNL
jgi:hypothetical protein